MSCRPTSEWLHREVDSLDESQRLLLDDHLASCASCRDDRSRLRRVRELGSALPVPPDGAREYSRAIARALLEGRARVEAPRVRRSWWAIPLAIGAAAAAAVAIVALVRRGASDGEGGGGGGGDRIVQRGSDADATPRRPAPPAAPAGDVVEAGTLYAGARALATGAAVPAGVPLRAAAPARVRLASLQVVIAADSEVRWSPVERTLLLDRGSVDVDATSREPVRIVTPRFEVELADAAVVVEPSSVHVQRGSARVVDRSNKLLAQLAPDGEWRPREPVAHAPRKRRAPAHSARELLTEARAELAAGQHADAARTAESSVARGTRTEQVEAYMLLAEVAQAAGDLGLAVARYQTVVSTFSDEPAAESALYAAARIELRRDRAAAAHALLERYVERYPSGRYTDDVRRQLATLRSP